MICCHSNASMINKEQKTWTANGQGKLRHCNESSELTVLSSMYFRSSVQIWNFTPYSVSLIQEAAQARVLGRQELVEVI